MRTDNTHGLKAATYGVDMSGVKCITENKGWDDLSRKQKQKNKKTKKQKTWQLSFVTGNEAATQG